MRPLLEELDAPAFADANGYLVNPCRPGAIGEEWQPPLRAVQRWCRRHFGARLVAVYLRGSVARGTAVPKVSDLDVTLVLGDDVQAQDYDACHARAQAVARRYPVCAGVEIIPYARTALLEWARARFQLKVFGLCLDGEDVLAGTAPFTMRDVPVLSVSSSIASARARFDARQLTCRGVAKQLIRAAYEQSLHEETCYSRDLVHCVRVACRRMPHARRLLERAARLVLMPTADAAKVLRLIDDFERALTPRPHALPPRRAAQSRPRAHR